MANYEMKFLQGTLRELTIYRLVVTVLECI